MTSSAQRFTAPFVFVATFAVYSLPMWLTERQALWFVAMMVVTLLVTAALVTYRHASALAPKGTASYVAFGLGASAGNLTVGALMAKGLMESAPLYAGNVLAVCVISLTLSGLALRRTLQLYRTGSR